MGPVEATVRHEEGSSQDEEKIKKIKKRRKKKKKEEDEASCNKAATRLASIYVRPHTIYFLYKNNKNILSSIFINRK